ncbi:MAG TPA: PAS domain S-box protein [Isosphaeraceae bacterium]|jgi:PAS domain S-box-containing protein|nr:PAS domain S-box protein [Isosphaeraceae bacterium]
MIGTALLADHLDARADDILAVWRAAVERSPDVPDSDGLSYREILDHVPELLDRLAGRLRGRPTDAASEGRKHGRARYRQGYDIAAVVAELGLLRGELSRATFAYAREHPSDLEGLEAVLAAINDVLTEATAAAVAQFQEESHAALEEARRESEASREATRRALLAAEGERAKLVTVLESLPVCVWVCDADGTMTAINREAERLQGFPAEAVVGSLDVRRAATHYRIDRPDGRALEADALPLARALRGEPVEGEEIHWRTPGGERIMLVGAVPLHDAAGALAGAMAVAQDITELKRAEARLRDQLVFSRTITDNLAKAVFAVDRDGRVSFANPAAERMFGWPAAELLGRDLQATIHHTRPDGTPRTAEECPLLSPLRDGRTARGDDVFLRRDGTFVPATFSSAPIVRDGAVTGAVMTCLDITDRKRLEAELAVAEARSRAIAERSPVMIWRADAEGHVDYVNQTWRDFRGRHGADDGWADGIHPDDFEAAAAAFAAALARRESFEITYRRRRHDGQDRWVTDRVTPYHDAAGRFLGLLGSCLDITERVELEEALQQQRELAEESSQHKTRLLSALSHDARTPLNAVVLSVQLLELYRRDDDDPEVVQCLRTIRHAVRNVLDLLGDLLNLTKIDAGALPVETSHFELGPVLAESLSSIEVQARVKGLDVRLEPGDLAAATVETDRSKVKQVLCNLLSNALRYTEQGHIRLRAERTADQLRIAVEDTGVGIAPADQQRIFDEFATLDHARRTPGEGTGLGLAICRRLANLLKGEITLRSEPGRGSTFTLALPATVLAAAPRAAAPSPTSDEPAAATGAILVVEDHLTSRQTLAKVLRRMGYRALEAGNGRDALDVVRQERPLAVLMDVNMPVMDGIDATLALRADPATRDLPIFALTGDVSVLNQRRIAEAGVDGYLEKPVTWDALKRALEAVTKRAD